MSTVTISQKEYQELINAKLHVEYLRQVLQSDIFASPPTKKVGDVVRSFAATKKYNRKFLQSLEKGLRRSSYFHKA